MNRMALCARCTNDIHLQVRRVPFEKLASLDGGESSAAIRTRVEAARNIPRVIRNGDVGAALTRRQRFDLGIHRPTTT